MLAQILDEPFQILDGAVFSFKVDETLSEC